MTTTAFRPPTETAEPNTTAAARVTDDDGGVLSAAEWRRPRVRFTVGTAQALLFVGLLVLGLGPLLWLAKSAITPTADTISRPMSLFPGGFAWHNVSTAWTDVRVGRYFWNTILLAFGSWVSQLVVATTGGFVLSVLRPKYATFVTGLLLGTLFVPAVVLLVPLYIEIVHPPVIHTSFIDSYWAVWLPAGASAFNVVLVKRFFDNLPREVFEAAKVDGAGAFRLFFSVVLPMSRPILGVVSVFAVLASWRDFLWPLLVLTNPDEQPLSVRLPSIQPQTELGVFLAALFIATLVPIAAFLIFQRSFLRGSGLGGAVKG
ncbi:MAG: multiple sugar transport system permease protein [Pseudonocardiales bacterium]|jgi:multiple sugar transport system permease protein|nr:multiple sugar transport system permease protein [Pseudonocardiales bacterium]